MPIDRQHYDSFWTNREEEDEEDRWDWDSCLKFTDFFQMLLTHQIFIKEKKIVLWKVLEVSYVDEVKKFCRPIQSLGNNLLFLKLFKSAQNLWDLVINFIKIVSKFLIEMETKVYNYT